MHIIIGPGQVSQQGGILHQNRCVLLDIHQVEPWDTILETLHLEMLQKIRRLESWDKDLKILHLESWRKVMDFFQQELWGMMMEILPIGPFGTIVEILQKESIGMIEEFLQTEDFGMIMEFLQIEPWRKTRLVSHPEWTQGMTQSRL